MNKRILTLCAFATLTLLACDASSLAQQFLDQPQPAAQEPEPTSAPVVVQPTQLAAPTAQSKAAPTTANTGGSPFAGALEKAKSATKYRIEFAMLFGSTNNNKYAEESFIDFKGEVDGTSAHLTSKGGVLAILAGGGQLEIVQAGGKTYMKGVTLFGVTDPKLWYVTDDQSTTSGFADFAKPDEFNAFTGGASANDFKKVRTEPLDGVSCDVYLYDFKSVKNSAITGLLGSVQDKDDFSAIDAANMNVWLCADGYVHKYTLNYEGHNAKAPTEKAALKMTGHIWDFGSAAIVVTVPKDAKPLPR
ncbi:MAG: hypothetical protein HY327_10285 [Chloroflexi bacterium]|nr:hypothetical protein [Chloroflexota bacterium]